MHTTEYNDTTRRCDGYRQPCQYAAQVKVVTNRPVVLHSIEYGARKIALVCEFCEHAMAMDHVAVRLS